MICVTHRLGEPIQITGPRSGTRVEVSVSDTGEGILEGDIPLIFDRFYRGEKSRNRGSGGVGLGLSIVKGIVDAHGGQIVVENLLSGGTRFTFTLPRKGIQTIEYSDSTH